MKLETKKKKKKKKIPDLVLGFKKIKIKICSLLQSRRQRRRTRVGYLCRRNIQTAAATVAEREQSRSSQSEEIASNRMYRFGD